MSPATAASSGRFGARAGKSSRYGSARLWIAMRSAAACSANFLKVHHTDGGGLFMSKDESSRGEDVTPRPHELIESIRDFGYTLPTAIADLVDNSITASATEITISIASDLAGHSHIAVVDNGRGMATETLVEALRLGSGGPPAIRRPTDLGRFGLGLKTASLSQGRSVTVITKRTDDRLPVHRRLDMDYIRNSGCWSLSTDLGQGAKSYEDKVAELPSGTAVIISNLDRTSFFQVPAAYLQEHLGHALRSVQAHLSMVFHRFIANGVRISLGATLLDAWDPFLKATSTVLGSESLPIGDQKIEVTPYVLPHQSKLSASEHSLAGGTLGWNAHQGFYIYRHNRLIVPGTWLNLSLKKEEHYKLARIAVDLPNTADAEWHLNVMKSHVAAPARLRDDLARIARHTRAKASEVYRYRGERAAPTNAPAQRFVWKRINTKNGVQFRVDRSHPAVQALLNDGCGHDAALNALLSMVESTVPIAAMLQEPSRALDGAPIPDDVTDLDAFVALARHAVLFYIRAGKSSSEARRLVLSAEPFVSWRDEIANRLDNPSGPHS
jgi:hypothetical protein